LSLGIDDNKEAKWWMQWLYPVDGDILTQEVANYIGKFDGKLNKRVTRLMSLTKMISCNNSVLELHAFGLKKRWGMSAHWSRREDSKNLEGEEQIEYNEETKATRTVTWHGILVELQGRWNQLLDCKALHNMVQHTKFWSFNYLMFLWGSWK
jgi:hypothetical protein